MKHNCIATLKRLTGDKDNKDYQTVQEGVRVCVVPTSNEVAAMFEVPIGSSYSYVILDEISKIEPADKFIITDPESSGLSMNAELLVRGDARKILSLGHTIYQGVGILT